MFTHSNKNYCRTMDIRRFNSTDRRHTDHGTLWAVAYLQFHVPEFIEPENWPPNSPHLNPVDYSVWEAFQQTCIVTKFQTLTG